jgi:integrase
MTKAEKPVASRRGRVELHHGSWRAVFHHRGQRIRQVLPDAKTERQAWDMMEALRHDYRAGRRTLDTEHARWNQIRDRFLRHHEVKGTSDETMRRYRQHLAHLDPAFDRARIEDVDPLSYAAARKREGAGPKTVKMELDLVRSMFRVAGLPARSMPDIKLPPPRDDWFSESELHRLLPHLPPALRPVVLFGFYTGQRKETVLALEWRSVDFERGIIRCGVGVKQNDRGALIPFKVIKPLAAMLAEQRARVTAMEHATKRVIPHVFVRDSGEPIKNLDDAWKSATRAAGFSGRTIHALRRSFAEWAANAPIPFSETDIMRIGGWLTPSAFRRYRIENPEGLAERVARSLNAPKTPPRAEREESGASV